MARLAVLASGNGSNFQAIASAIGRGPHTLCCLICDRRNARVIERAEGLGIPSFTVRYARRERSEAEQEILSLLRSHDVDLVVLAGFMRLLSPLIVDEYERRIVNIHPSLLPKYPGANAIPESYRSSDAEVGITIHWVDHGVDSGPIIVQKRLSRVRGESLDDMERRIHELEHHTYPEVVMQLLDELDTKQAVVGQNARRTQ